MAQCIYMEFLTLGKDMHLGKGHLPGSHIPSWSALCYLHNLNQFNLRKAAISSVLLNFVK